MNSAVRPLESAHATHLEGGPARDQHQAVERRHQPEEADDLFTVLVLHRLVAHACARSPRLRKILRGEPRPLVTRGVVLDDALAKEEMTRDELLAGLRKLGFASPEEGELAVLEETGHISAVRLKKSG